MKIYFLKLLYQILFTKIDEEPHSLHYTIIKELKNEGYETGGEPLNEEDFEHISPAPFEHINRLGKYNFKDEIKLEENGLRALRKPKK